MTSNIPETLLSPENTICDLEANSKKALIENIAKQIHRDVNSETWESLFDALIAREKYGSTGFGNGIALPHCRLSSCQQPTAFFTKLKSPIDFDSIDGEPVDLVFTLVVPENATDKHLEILAKLASILDKNALRISLRDSQDDSQLFKRISKMLSNQD